MKKLNLFFGLLIVAASFQACHSPEARGAKDDSLAKDSTKTDSTATKTDTTAGKTDTTKTMGTKPDSTASPKK